MKIVVVSMSCCNPALGVNDNANLERVRDAARRASVDAEIQLMTGTEFAMGLTQEQAQKVMPLFRKYGVAAAPAILIDGELEFFGGIPPTEKMVEAFSRRARV